MQRYLALAVSLVLLSFSAAAQAPMPAPVPLVGDFEDFDIPGAFYTQPTGIDRRGQVVGFYALTPASGGSIGPTYGFIFRR